MISTVNRTYSDDNLHADMDRHHLPTLAEVLSRRTRAPVDLFSFYIYMRDQQRSVDYLDFWYAAYSRQFLPTALTLFPSRLDVSQHMSLCRHYVRELRRSVLLDTPELEKAAESKRTSQIEDNFDLRDGAEARDSPKSEISQDQRLSAFLRTERIQTGHSDSDSANSRSDYTTDRAAAPRTAFPLTEQPPRPSFMTSNNGGETTDSSSPNNYTSPQHTVQRSDIRASAEKILYTFLLPGSEREIILPQGLLAEITESIEERGRDDPEVFDAAKDYVFQAMERDAYPGFLRSKALGNLVPLSLMVRLIIGLLAMFGAFWTAFVLIFLDSSRRTRCWVCPGAVPVKLFA